MYKSSANTSLYKYVVYPLLIALFVYPDVAALIHGNILEYYWANFAAPMSWWAITWFVIFTLRVRSLQADESGITILSGRRNKNIAYKDILYVSEIALFRPHRFALKYQDPETGRTEKILVISPPTADMAGFIRQQIRSENPSYTSDLEPSQWSTPRLALITSIPFVLYAVIQNVFTL